MTPVPRRALQAMKEWTVPFAIGRSFRRGDWSNPATIPAVLIGEQGCGSLPEMRFSGGTHVFFFQETVRRFRIARARSTVSVKRKCRSANHARETSEYWHHRARGRRKKD